MEDDEIGGSSDSEDAGIVMADANAEAEEQSYETRHNLLPFPAENQRNFPQEDVHYFARRKYVRNDKYSLNDMLSFDMGDDDELPTIRSAFKIN